MTKQAPKTSAHAIADVPTDDLVKRIAKITSHLDEIDALMHDAVELTSEERKVALRLQGDEEKDALTGVVQFAEKRPELFKVLGAEDDGSNPDVFETELLVGRLANAAALTNLVARVQKTVDPISDSALYVTTLAKRPALAAYEIAKPYRARDREYGKLLNAAVDLYRAHALSGAKTRAANQAAKAKNPPA